MKILKLIWPVLVIFLVWSAFSSPFFLKGKVPFPSDYLVNNFAPWSAYPGFAGPVKNAATPDVITQIFPWKALTIDILKSGNVPLWNPYSFSGTPLLANYQSAALTPVNLLYFILPFITAWSIQVLLAPLLAGLFTYLFVRSLKVGKEAAVISSISFMFCGFMVGWMPYGTLTYAICFLPLSLFAIEKYFSDKKWYYLLLLAATVPLSFFSGHFQISLYFLLFTLAYLAFKSYEARKIKFFISSLVAIAAGLLISAPQLLPSMELYQNAVRSNLFLKIEVIPWGYLATFFAPDFFGNPVTRNDWFGHYAEWNGYIGIVAFALGIYAFTRRSRTIMFFGIAALVAILLSFQSPIVDLFIAAKIPVLSTSAVGRIIVLFSFSFCVLAGFGFDSLFDNVKNRKFGYIILWVLGLSVVFALLWLVAYFKIFIPQEWAQVAVSNLKLPSLIFITFVVTVIIVCVMKHRHALVIFPVIIILLVLLDSVRFANKWIPFMNASNVYPELPISKQLKTSEFSRVFGNFGAESYITYKMQGVDGYDPLYIARYGEFLNAAKDGLYHVPERTGVNLEKDGEFTPQIINLLGMKYFISKIADGRQPWAFPVHKYPTDQFKTIYEDNAYQIFENQKAFERAFVAGSYVVEGNNRQILEKMFRSENDLKKVVILEEEPNISNSNASGSAKITKYSPNNVKLEVETSGPALLVLSDPYYPGWVAAVNGSSTKIYRANYALRAVELPAGKSEVEFLYRPASFRNGLVLAALGVLVLTGLIGYNFKRR